MLVKVLKDHQKSEDAGRWDARLDVSVREPLKLVSKKKSLCRAYNEKGGEKMDCIGLCCGVIYECLFSTGILEWFNSWSPIKCCFELVYWSGSTLGHL